MKNLKILSFCLMLLFFAAPMMFVAGSGQVQVTLMQLAKTDGGVIFTIVVKNTGTEFIDVVQVTVDGESPFNITSIPNALGVSAYGVHSLTGDYSIGVSYPVAVTVTFSDHTTTTLAQSVICTAGSTRNVGVQVGDWFNYSVTLGGNLTLPPDNWLVGLEWDLVQVTDVSGTNVTEQCTRHYQNGSETIINSWVDVSTGESSAHAWGDFIAADLSVGDAIYANSSARGYYYNLVITATEPRMYPDGTRETNYAIDTWGVDCYTEYTWDRSTGVMVGVFEKGTTLENWQDGGYKDTRIYTLQFTLVDSKVWVVPEFSTWAPLLALFAAFTLVAVYKRKQLKTPTR